MIEKWSNILQQFYEFDPHNGTIKFQDGIEYNRKELELLKNFDDHKMKIAVHKIKKEFGGKIIG